jgi:cobalamin biosynthesis protein CobT
VLRSSPVSSTRGTELDEAPRDRHRVLRLRARALDRLLELTSHLARPASASTRRVAASRSRSATVAPHRQQSESARQTPCPPRSPNRRPLA